MFVNDIMITGIVNDTWKTMMSSPLSLLLIPPLFLFLNLAYSFPSSSNCTRTCGATTVPFPLGFSSPCQIPLRCSFSPSGLPEIRIGEFLIRNFTWNHLLVDVPPSCHRPLAAAAQFSGPNFAMTSRNSLLLRNCSSSVSGCSIPTQLIARRFGLGACGPKDDNISCYSGGIGDGFIAFGDLASTRCGSLFSSTQYDADDEPFPSLVFRTVEIGWWLDGECRCSPLAVCQPLVSPASGKQGFRCRCDEGFEGDGFLDGEGCRRAITPACNGSSCTSYGGDGNAKLGVLVGGIIAGACILAGLAVILYMVRRRSTSLRIRKCTKLMLSQASCTLPLYSYKDMERATNGFSDVHRLGTGAYGTVYAGRLSNDMLVAVKRIRHRDTGGVEQIMNEIRLLSSVSHPNLVRLLGCCIERGEQILVYEFMDNGTLSQHLQRERGNGLPWAIRLAIAAETANAIAYLHSEVKPPIYHRDIKSSNILLDYSYNSKVADFGLSRMGIGPEMSHISTAPQGTPGYLDPQYHQNFHLSDKSDVYSFGVVLAEIITALKVVDFNRAQSEVNLAALAAEKIGRGMVEEIIDPFLEPHSDAWTLSSIHKVAELAFRCLAYNRDVRPSMTEVADELEQIRLGGWAPTSGDQYTFMSTGSSLCSSPSNGGGASRRTESKRSVRVNLVEEIEVESPPPALETWFGDQSSPSTNSLLGNVVH